MGQKALALAKRRYSTQWVPIYWLCFTKKRAGSKPVAKLSDRSAIRKKLGFFCWISLVLAQKWRRSWGRSGASWRHLEAPYGFKFFFIYIKSYMSYNLCSIIFFVSPLLLGAPLLIEVGGDQEPPGNTSRYPMGSKNFLLILNHIWATICLI